MIDLYDLGVCSFWQVGYPLVDGVLRCYYTLLHVSHIPGSYWGDLP